MTARNAALSATSVFHVITLSNVPPLRVYFESSSNRQYSLYTSTNLDTGPWTVVPGQSNIEGQGECEYLTDTNSLPNNAYFYRLGVNP